MSASKYVHRRMCVACVCVCVCVCVCACMCLSVLNPYTMRDVCDISTALASMTEVLFH